MKTNQRARIQSAVLLQYILLDFCAWLLKDVKAFYIVHVTTALILRRHVRRQDMLPRGRASLKAAGESST